MALDKEGSSRTYAAFSVAGNGSVTINDDIAMGEYGARVGLHTGLGVEMRRHGERQNGEGADEFGPQRDAAHECGERLFEEKTGKNEHNGTSLFALVCASAWLDRSVELGLRCGITSV